MWIEGKLKNIWNQISKSERAAFGSAFLAGMLMHMYIWTNTIPNFDGISRVYEEQQATLVGRWFLHYASYLHGFTQMPMLIGVLAMFFLGAAALVVVRLFHMKSALLAGCWGVMAAAFPAVAYTNSYTFTASAYFLAILLAVGSVSFVRKNKGWWGFLAGSFLLALAMGTYQAYVCVAITLSLLLVLFDMLHTDFSWRRVVENGFRFVLFICLGTGIYYLILQIFLKSKDLKILSYLNMDQVADGYPLQLLGSIIIKTYAQVGEFFFIPGADNAFSNTGLVILHGSMLLLMAALLMWRIHKNAIWKEGLRLAGIGVLLLLLPMAVNFAQILSPFSTPTPIMKYAYVYWYFLLLLLMDRCCPAIGKESGARITVTVRSAEIAASAVLVLTIGYFWQYDNVLYTMLNQAHRATQSFVTNVVGRIESCEGYKQGMQVVIVGGFPSDRYYADVENYHMVQQGGALSASVIPLNKHIYYYMNDWLNVPIQEPAEEDFLRIAAMEEFKTMPLYPDDGSVQVIDDCVVVKMQETFTPKAQYEKEYENRR